VGETLEAATSPRRGDRVRASQPLEKFQGLDAVLSLLWCPRCQKPLRRDLRSTISSEGALVCEGCGARTAICGGIPRFVDQPADPVARHTQASFGYEWTHFHDWSHSGEKNFLDYFSKLDLCDLSEAVVLDAGCGMGRHAKQLAPYVRQILAVDFSRAIESTARNVSHQHNVVCLQADLTDLPVRDGVCDFVYSMGVVHHLADTQGAVLGLARKVRPGGRLRLYLYWKRTGFSGVLLRFVSYARHLTTRLPFPLLRGFCWVLSAALYGTLILPYRGLKKFGVNAPSRWPLYVYTKYPFRVLYNDQFDRFSAPLEKRYTAEEAAALLQTAGLRDVSVIPMFGWIVEGVK